MIKTAIIIERTDIYLGGAERSISELVSELGNCGVEVTLLAAKGTPDQPNTVILCGKYPGKRTPYKMFQKALHTHLAQNSYDIIHSTLPFDFSDIYQPRGGTYTESIIRNAASYPNRVSRLYKRLTHAANTRRYRMLSAERWLCRPGCKTKIAAISEYVKSQFIRHYDLSPDRISVIPNGIRLSANADQEKADKLRVRIMEAIKAEPFVRTVKFLFAANNFRLKGLEPLIRATAHIAKLKPDLPLCVAVAGSDRFGKYDRLAGRLGVKNRLIHLGTLGGIHDAMSVCDVAVLPTYYDPCSRLILEALGMGRPVITTRFNGAAELYVNGRHGTVIDDPNNITALADAMLYFAEPANIAAAQRAIAEDGIAQGISIERHAGELIRLYELILRGKRKSQ